MSKKKNNKITFTLSGVPKTRNFTTSEIGRGIGIHTPLKGKGSYKRNDKHKKAIQMD